jgi:pyrophosphatase PpaX
MNGIDGVIFDLDGTLADTMSVCLQAFQETLQYYSGSCISLDELYPMFGPSEEGILRLLLPDQGTEAYQRYLASYLKFHQDCTNLFPGIDDLLDVLSSIGVRTAIATGKSPETAEISMQALGLTSRVERLETGFIDRGDKPELIRRILTEWKMPPSRAAYVGDVLSDLHAAEQVGVLPIGAAWAATSPLRGIEPQDGWLLFEQVYDLAAWIQTDDH